MKLRTAALTTLLLHLPSTAAFAPAFHQPHRRTVNWRKSIVLSPTSLVATAVDESVEEIVNENVTVAVNGGNVTATVETTSANGTNLNGNEKDIEALLEASVEEVEEEEEVAANVTVTASVEEEEEDSSTTSVLEEEVQLEATIVASEMIDEECEIDPQTGKAKDDVCVDEEAKEEMRVEMEATVAETLRLVSTGESSSEEEEVPEPESSTPTSKTSVFTSLKNLVLGSPKTKTKKSKAAVALPTGEELEQGWEKRANSSSLKRNAEVWKFALQAVFRALKPRKMRKKGDATEAEIEQAQIEAAEFIRDNLLRLGPSFVKLGQVASTRTDVLPKTFTDVLKTLTDDVPGFSGARAKEIVARELGRPVDEVFEDFSAEPLKAASLGQVHTAMYKGKKVAIKVQRSGLKELFDIDLKNLRKLAVLLDKFDPKSDGADRDWVSIYDESEKQLYKEIDYLNEASNTERFANDFADYDWVRIPKVYQEVTTPRVLVMEFVDSFKLTDVATVEANNLDRKLLAKRVADSFLRQVVETGYFHADPHSGNLCVDTAGNLVFYDFGQMDELKPNVGNGLKTFCKALFAGGPMISDLQLAKNAKLLVNGVEEAGVLSKAADRLSVEKLARYFMRTFKDAQLGKKGSNIKETLGADLQTLTENNSFRFPSTFTFVFRAYVSVEGIGKELDPDFDLGQLAQPFIEKFIDDENGYKSDADKRFAIFKKATGLNKDDINTAVMQPRKIAYLEETVRAMESGSLKIRVRSLENEKALERMGLRQGVVENMLLASVFFNVAGLATKAVVRNAGIAGAAYFLLQSFVANSKVKKFDKTQAKYVASEAFETGSSSAED